MPPQTARQSRPFQRENAGERRPLGIKPKQPAKWSHQRQLEDAKGKEIAWIYKLSEEWCHGTLLEADQFTIMVQMNSPAQTIVIFKSELAAFKA